MPEHTIHSISKILSIICSQLEHSRIINTKNSDASSTHTIVSHLYKNSSIFTYSLRFQWVKWNMKANHLKKKTTLSSNKSFMQLFEQKESGVQIKDKQKRWDGKKWKKRKMFESKIRMIQKEREWAFAELCVPNEVFPW